MPIQDPMPPDTEQLPIRHTISEAERAKLRQVHWDWLRFIALCGVLGIAIGIFAAVFVIQADISGIGTMITRSPNALGYKLLLAAGFAHTFGIVSMGIGILIRSEYF